MKKIIVDTLGADNGSRPIIKGVLRALREIDELEVVFVGISEDIQNLIAEESADFSKIEILHTTRFVSDTDLPTCVFKGAEDTSMVMSLTRMKEDDDIIGMISSGNTGALLVGTICHIGLVPGLHAPALATALPCKKDGLVCLVDCGANTDCKPEDLRRFAVMGNAFMQSLVGKENPKVALMSVGTTRHKGNTLIKEAYSLIESLPLNFIGNIEGSDMINGEADVIVTDGFTGNILLKNTEAAGLAAIRLIDEFDSSIPQLQAVREKLYNMFAFNDQGGATFLGVRKAVIKMHGCANEKTAYACVKQLLNLENRHFSKRVSEAVEELQANC